MNFLNNLKKVSLVSICLLFLLVSASGVSHAQDRDRVIDNETKAKAKEKVESRPTVRIIKSPESKSAGLTNQIVVVKKKEEPASLVKKTSSSRAIGDDPSAAKSSGNMYSATMQAMMMQSIRAKMGIKYRYGSQGPNTYDCSGFVWKVFQESGFDFTRTSASNFWQTFEPVYGNDRFQFGTLVFFNNLGHVGIVADENGFYHASTSKGITYSTFSDYWKKRIVGYRRVPVQRY
ncbi:MAG: C40 family peptidase [Acidobacteria bacterium]|nr:C40 family peptidase [Acidobacteriota bacterium]